MTKLPTKYVGSRSATQAEKSTEAQQNPKGLQGFRLRVRLHGYSGLVLQQRQIKSREDGRPQRVGHLIEVGVLLGANFCGM